MLERALARLVQLQRVAGQLGRAADADAAGGAGAGDGWHPAGGHQDAGPAATEATASSKGEAEKLAAEQALLMATLAAYPDRVAHRTAHDLFLQDLAVSAQEIRASGITPRVLDWACGRLPQWLRFHIETNDRPLARHLERVALRRGEAPSQQRS